MQLQLDDAALFVRIVELGTLSAAARERDVPVSHVTRSLARLEKACGVRLLHRTTHGLSLSDEGDTFLAYAHRLLDLSDEMNSEVTGKLSGPNGWVRVSASQVMAQRVIAPSLKSLYARYPNLHIDLMADDRPADMARDGIDIAIRSGNIASDTEVARKLSEHSRSLYASPAYLAEFGTPKHPDDLKNHRLLSSSASPVLNRWSMTPDADQGLSEYLVQGYTRTDNSAVMLTLVLEGAGISRMIDMVALPLVRSGHLVPLLRDYFINSSVPIHAVMLKGRHKLPKIRACVDHWAQWLQHMQTGQAA